MSDEQQLELKEQEREEILEEIDELVTTNRLPVSEGMEKLHAKRSGIAFPLVINLFAIAAVLSTFYFSNRLFEQKQETLSLENTTYQSAEGKLLEELKKESAAQIEQKEQEINNIQNELAELDRQSRQLAESMDQQIADREAELRLTLEAELTEERLKLKSQGKSETAIELELERIEEQRKTEFETELEIFRTDAKAAITAKEEELALAKQLNEEMLTEVNSEKERIQNETKKRETELTAKFEAEKATLADEAAAAEAELELLTANQTRESLIIDQINSLYRTIFTSIENKNFEQASLQIDSLSKLIDDPNIALLKAVSNRSRNDRDIINILQQKIEEQSYSENTDTKSLAAAAELLLSAQEIVELGNTAYTEGRNNDAANYYTRSLERIPTIKQAWENLKNISAETENIRLSEYIDRGTELVEENRLMEAIEQFRIAARSASTNNPDLLKQALSGIIESADRIRRVETTERDIKISSLEEQSSMERRQIEQKLEEQERSYISQLTENNVEWEQKLADAEIAYSNLEIEKDNENERLTRLIGERDQENLRLNSEKEEATTMFTAAQEEIAAINLQLDEYKELSADEIAQLNNELAAAELRYKELTSSFQGEQEVVASRLKASEVTGYNNGIKQGRVEAFTDIIEVTSYLDGSSTLNSDSESRITELAASEPFYEKAIQKIQKLASSFSSGSSSKIIPVEQPILIGSISFASGNEIVIEPLSNKVIEPGTRITIYRKERNKDEYYITFGIVTAATENKISAKTDAEGTIQARSMDLVYITK